MPRANIFAQPQVPVAIMQDLSGSGGGTGTTSVTFADSPSLDAFGLQRTTGKPGNRFDIEFIYNKQPDVFDEITNGVGSVTWNSNTRDLTLATNGATASDTASMFGFDVPYTPGSSQLVESTSVMNLADIAGGEAFVFLRSSISGTPVTTTYAQSAWNGEDVSDVDWSKSQIFAIDFQSLKVGRIRFALVRDGVITPVHSITNDNTREGGYWQHANHPPSFRIYNDATHTYMEIAYGDTNNGVGFMYRVPVNASATMRAICVTVKSEGGVPLFDMPGYNRSTDLYVTSKTISNTDTPILSIRPSATFGGVPNRGLYIPDGFQIITDQGLYYEILFNATLTGASWTNVDATNSGMEQDIAATAVSGGVKVASGYLTDARDDTNVNGILGKTLLFLGRTGTPRSLTIAGRRTTGTDASVFAGVQWREIR